MNCEKDGKTTLKKNGDRMADEGRKNGGRETNAADFPRLIGLRESTQKRVRWTLASAAMRLGKGAPW